VDTVLAFATAVAFSLTYFFSARIDSALASFLVFTVLGTGVVCVLLPVSWVLVVRGEGLAALGITTFRWRLALAISAFLAAGSFPELLRAARHPGADLAPHLLVNALALWEPFFVFGWLQLRFERAFGVLPGVVLAALSFGVYHLGTFPLPAVFALVGFGFLYAALFRAVGANLLVLWPLTWAVGSGIGTLQGGLAFGWSSAPGAVALLLVQTVAIVLLARRSS
jgi:membrane protease YdiL (CAAX protease family)